MYSYANANWSGVKLILDIGVLDTVTCEPLENVLVELWSGMFLLPHPRISFSKVPFFLANATGVYGSYSSTMGGPMGPPPSGPPHRGPPGRGGGPRGSPPMVRNETFLRGGWQTDENGIVELTTLYPGFYAGRAPHIHTMVHKDWVMSENGWVILVHLYSAKVSKLVVNIYEIEHSSRTREPLSTMVNFSSMKVGMIGYLPTNRIRITRTKGHSTRTIIYFSKRMQMGIMHSLILSSLGKNWRMVYWDISVRIMTIVCYFCIFIRPVHSNGREFFRFLRYPEHQLSEPADSGLRQNYWPEDVFYRNLHNCHPANNLCKCHGNSQVSMLWIRMGVGSVLEENLS